MDKLTNCFAQFAGVTGRSHVGLFQMLLFALLVFGVPCTWLCRHFFCRGRGVGRTRQRGLRHRDVTESKPEAQ